MMSRSDSTGIAENAVPAETKAGAGGPPREPSAPPSGAPRGRGGALFKQYKPDQGKVTRVGTFVGLGAIIAWGGKFIYDRLAVYEGFEVWRLLVTTGLPILVPVVLGAVAWWVVFAHRGSGDFMIATEGEMKKVSWSSKREVLGSTKVVITFTALLAILLFVVDLIFQRLFSWIGVLKA